MNPQYWLMKSEPSVYSIEDLQHDGFTNWEGVRNFQVRNFMLNDMKVGDMAFFYHSNANPSGIAGLCRVCREAIPDKTALDPTSDYYDPKASPEKPIWFMVEVEFVKKFSHLIPLSLLRATKELKDLAILKRGSRLSITPVEEKDFEFICHMAEKP